jgi:hypothetical protein
MGRKNSVIIFDHLYQAAKTLTDKSAYVLELTHLVFVIVQSAIFFHALFAIERAFLNFICFHNFTSPFIQN